MSWAAVSITCERFSPSSRMRLTISRSTGSSADEAAARAARAMAAAVLFKGGLLFQSGTPTVAPALPPPQTAGYSTITRSVPPRPKVSGWYISSAFGGGTTNVPGVVARAT